MWITFLTIVFVKIHKYLYNCIAILHESNTITNKSKMKIKEFKENSWAWYASPADG